MENDTYSSATNTFSSLYFRSESGFVSEHDSYSRPGCSGTAYSWYSIQVNTNIFKTNAYGGSEGWEQFVFQNEGCPNYNKGDLYVTFDEVNYLLNHNNCPSSSWVAIYPDCYLTDPNPPTQTPFLAPASLTSAHIYGQTSASWDNAELCISGVCYAATTACDCLGLYPNKWAHTEANILGFGGGSEAVFNSGVSLELQINNIGSTTTGCSQTASVTGEEANFNFGSCSYSSSSISWSQNS